MPSGYTADVLDGKITTLPDFLRLCARAFILDLRDEPWNAPIPRTSAIQEHGIGYHAKARAEALDEIHRLHGLTREQIEAEAQTAIRAEVEDWTARRVKRAQIRERYDTMMTQVRAWDAPPALANIQAFAIEQLTESRKFDGDDPEPRFDPEPTIRDGALWLSERLEKLQKEVEYHASEGAKAQARFDSWSGFYGAVCDELERLDALEKEKQ